jgi:hypothetical protein
VADTRLEAEPEQEQEDGNADGKRNGNGRTGNTTVVHKKGDKETARGNCGNSRADAVSVETPQLCRFDGSAFLDPERVGSDAPKIAEETMLRLTSITGAEGEVTLEIQAHIPDGALPELVRTITENYRTLKFADHESEEQ